MLFNSLDFLIFFPIVVFIYFIVPVKWKCLWLLVASYYFYICWNPRHIVLMIGTTLLTWMTGIAIGWLKETNDVYGSQWQKVCIYVCCIGEFGILCFFKYFDFLLGNVNIVLEQGGFSRLENPFHFMLPIGISFYTFQAVGYVADVYRGKVPAEKNIIKYALFISFFPQLVAGPIERTENLLYQMNQIPRKKLIDYERITNGLFYMLYGFFLKLVIADRVAVLVDTVFEKWYLFGTVELIVGAIGFAVQIYCDFSSYSTIAIGAAQVMGFELMENFEAPYFAESIKEFWRRWHISLSAWFRDYVYIPLGGSRCSKIRKYSNLIITFLVSGLWHGADWTYVVWGGVHGLYQIIGELTEALRKNLYISIGIKLNSVSYKIGRIFTTFVLVDTAWIFFRADSMKTAVGYIKSIFICWNPWAISDGTLYRLGLSHYECNILFVGLVVLFMADLVKRLKGQRIDTFFNTQGPIVKGIFVVFLIFVIGVFGWYGGEFDARQFIYFQF